ncbi:MAG: thioesterase family protein [Actinomycetota bacterium]|nr:thioesterase family protein [Actinomycetota bacterium]MDP2289325.1 thioesterase family protein [Actinomycetota bacterium]
MTELADIVRLNTVSEDRFVTSNIVTNGGFLYGGQLLAQALMAACKTVESQRVPHSLHCYFIAGGKSTEPIEFAVSRDRDGRAYSARSISAIQDGRVLMNMLASFQVPEEGINAQASTFPSVTAPPANPVLYSLPTSPDALVWDPAPDSSIAHPSRAWCRFESELPDDPALQACALAYMSDFFNGLVRLPGFPRNAAVSSLDHAMWFYRPTKMNEWHLMDWVGNSVSGGRGHYSGQFYDASGVLVASVAQEALVRIPRA